MRKPPGRADQFLNLGKYKPEAQASELQNTLARASGLYFRNLPNLKN